MKRLGSNQIKYVPEEMVVRVIKWMKDSQDTNLLTKLGKLDYIVVKNIDKETLGRMICEQLLPENLLTDKEKIEKRELQKADMALMGIWSSKVQPEAVLAEIILFDGNNDKRRLYLDSVEKIDELDTNQKIIAKRLLG